MFKKLRGILKVCLLFLLSMMLGETLGALPCFFVPQEYLRAFAMLFAGIGNIIAIYFIVYICNDNMKCSFQFNKINFNLSIKSIFLGLGTMSISYLISLFLVDICNLGMLGSNAELYSTLNKSVIGILYMSFLGPIIEEITCRGFLLSRFRKFLGIKSSIILQAILFGVLHGNPVQFIITFVIGIILGYVCYYTKSIYPSMIIHITNNTLCNFNFEWLNNNSILFFIILTIFIVLGVYIFRQLKVNYIQQNKFIEHKKVS